MRFSTNMSTLGYTFGRRLGAFVVALLLVVPVAASAQTTDAAIRSMLQERDREIKMILGDRDTFTPQQREQLKDLINGLIDFKAMGQQALGPHWGDLTAAQRSTFVDVFSDIVRSQSLADLDVYRSQVNYQTVDVSGDSAYVVTTTVYKEVPATVAYVLGRDAAGWRAHDIILDDVSTAEGYARSFQTVIRKRGFDALMTSLHKKRDQMNAQS